MHNKEEKSRRRPWLVLVLSLLLGPLLFLRVVCVFGKSAHPTLEFLAFALGGFVSTWILYAMIMLCCFPLLRRVTQGKKR